MLHHRLSDTIRTELGVTRTPWPVLGDELATATPTVKRAAERHKKNAVKQVERLFWAMIDPVDPSPLPKNHVRTKAELARLAKPLTAQETADRQRLLDWATGRILEATWLMLHRRVRRAWKGSIGHDATFVSTWSRGRVPTSAWASTDPDAGWYVRNGDHKAPDDIGGRHHKDGTPKSKYGYDAEIAVVGADDPDDLRRFPLLAFGVRLHKPGHAPGPNCVEVLRDIRSRHTVADPVTGRPLFGFAHPDGPAADPHPAGWLGADRAYNNSKKDNWLLPALALGYDPVFDYPEDELGRPETHPNGMVMVDGTWYSPSIRSKPALVTATKDLLAGRITIETHAARIKAREEHAMRPFDRKKNEQGRPSGAIKWACPASGKPGTSFRPTAHCALKPFSTPTGAFDGRPVMLIPVAVAGEAPPDVCTQQTVTIDAAAYSKHQQTLAHRSKTWTKVYGSLRNTIEGTNATAKDGSKQPIEPGDRRRVRGIAATSLIVAVLLAARNLRKIATFMRTADMSDDGSMAVTKPKAKRARRPQLDDWHPDQRAKRAAALLAAANKAAVAADPDPPPDTTKARASARARRAAKTK